MARTLLPLLLSPFYVTLPLSQSLWITRFPGNFIGAAHLTGSTTDIVVVLSPGDRNLPPQDYLPGALDHVLARQSVVAAY